MRFFLRKTISLPYLFDQQSFEHTNVIVRKKVVFGTLQSIWLVYACRLCMCHIIVANKCQTTAIALLLTLRCSVVNINGNSLSYSKYCSVHAFHFSQNRLILFLSTPFFSIFLKLISMVWGLNWGTAAAIAFFVFLW